MSYEPEKVIQLDWYPDGFYFDGERVVVKIRLPLKETAKLESEKAIVKEIEDFLRKCNLLEEKKDEGASWG
jgi:hypothetical protein